MEAVADDVNRCHWSQGLRAVDLYRAALVSAAHALQLASLDSLDDVVLAHTELVRRIAYHLISRLPASVEVDDLVQAGMLGLLDAARNYSADRGASFETYAGIRIRGSMLDEVRRASWAPRSAVRRSRQISAAALSVATREGREATASETAQQLGVSLAAFHKAREEICAAQLLSFDLLQADPQQAGLLSGAASDCPEELLHSEQFEAALVAAIAALPERERTVLSLYYDDDLTMREIGTVLNVTESRVCQIHRQAVLRIRARLGREFLSG